MGQILVLRTFGHLTVKGSLGGGQSVSVDRNLQLVKVQKISVSEMVSRKWDFSMK